MNNDEILHKINKIEKMLEMLLNEEQKEEIKEFDIKFLEQQKSAITGDIISKIGVK